MGIGKTRLLVEATRLVTARGARVLSARGSQLEQSFGFGAVHPDVERREGRWLLPVAVAASQGGSEAILQRVAAPTGGAARRRSLSTSDW